MSAIAGIFSTDYRPVDLKAVSRLAEAIRGLGPDRQEVWVDGPVGILHALMSISPEEVFDEQPLVKDSLVLAANAQLDNRDELSRELRVDPSRARCTPDSALILGAYQKWAEDCPTHLLGDFAFAIWDTRRRRLFCARDHLGNVPLYYYQGNSAFAFSTVARHLLLLPNVSRRLNEDRISEFLLGLPSEQKTTFYEAVRCLPAGHSITVSAKSTKLSRYWSLEEIPAVRFHKDEDYVFAFKELLETSVSCRMRTSHRMASFLSGGLDSSSVSVIAAQRLRCRQTGLLTYTSVPQEDSKISNPRKRFGDERPFVAEIVRFSGNLLPNYVTMKGRSPIDKLETTFHIAGPPFNPFNYTWHQAIGEKAREHGVRLMLAASGGNFAVSRDGRNQLAVLARKGQWYQLLKELRHLAKHTGNSMSGLFRSEVLKPLFLPKVGWIRNSLNRLGVVPHWYRYSPIHPDFAKTQDISGRFRSFDLKMARAANIRHRYIPFEIIEQVLGNASRDYANVWKAQYHINVRDPTRDKRLVAYSLGVPDDQYLRDGRDRLLLRKAMARMLPEVVVSNVRLGHQGVDWMHLFDSVRNEMAGELEQLRSTDLVPRILDLDRMHRLLARWHLVDTYSSQAEREYRHLFTRGLVLGKFIRWHQNV